MYVCQSVSPTVEESHRTWWDRSSEHINALKTKNEKNALVKHWVETHGDQQSPPDFQFGVITTCRSALERQIKEAIHIQTSKLDILLNSKGEWGLNMIPQLKITEGGDLVDDQLTDKRDHKLTETPQVSMDNREDSKNNFFSQHSQRKRRLREQKASENGNPTNGSGIEQVSNDQLQPTFAGLSSMLQTAHVHRKSDGQFKSPAQFQDMAKKHGHRQFEFKHPMINLIQSMFFKLIPRANHN